MKNAEKGLQHNEVNSSLAFASKDMDPIHSTDLTIPV